MKGFPNVIFEAMAAMVPVVAFSAGGVSELIQHGYSGLLVEERNVVDLANALLRLKLNKQLRSTIAKNAYDKL